MNAAITPQSIEGVADIASVMRSMATPVPEWRKLFRSLGEMEQGEMKFLIDGFLPEGITFLGGLSGVGKTWFALSIAKALATGQPFLDRFAVPETCNILYLIPESGAKPFRKRLERMGIPNDDRFLCRTMKDGLLDLTDAALLEAVQTLHPVIFLDTAVRFSHADSENDALQNSNEMASDLFGLLKAGARAIVGLHHSPKSSAGKNMTLENVLRGTGDLGAMCDAVYGIQCVDIDEFRIRVKAVKVRDFDESPAQFEIQGRPYINETGNFGEFTSSHPIGIAKKVSDAIAANRTISLRKLADLVGSSKTHVSRLATAASWTQQNGQWTGGVPS